MKVTAVHAQAGPAASQARQGAGQNAAGAASRFATGASAGSASSSSAGATFDATVASSASSAASSTANSTASSTASSTGDPSSSTRNAAQGSPASASARVTTTSFGFSLGKFGLRYTQDEVTVGPDQSALRAAQRLARFRASQKANAFAEDMASAGEYNTLSETEGADTVQGTVQGAAGAGQGSSASAGTSAEPLTAAQRRYGLAAYARAVSGEEEVSMGWGLGEV